MWGFGKRTHPARLLSFGVALVLEATIHVARRLCPYKVRERDLQHRTMDMGLAGRTSATARGQAVDGKETPDRRAMLAPQEKPPRGGWSRTSSGHNGTWMPSDIRLFELGRMALRSSAVASMASCYIQQRLPSLNGTVIKSSSSGLI